MVWRPWSLHCLDRLWVAEDGAIIEQVTFVLLAIVGGPCEPERGRHRPRLHLLERTVRTGGIPGRGHTPDVEGRLHVAGGRLPQELQEGVRRLSRDQATIGRNGGPEALCCFG